MKLSYASPVAVSPGADYTVIIDFDNGEQRLLDVKPYLADPFWAKLSQPAFFAQVAIEGPSIGWPGDVDIDPEEVYFNSVPV
jgi:hypothetical protein